MKMTAKFTLAIKCKGAAFDDETGTVTHESAAPELARILRDVARRIEDGDSFDTFRNCHDINGNVVGAFALKIQEED
jgi:hypothetical protein